MWPSGTTLLSHAAWHYLSEAISSLELYFNSNLAGWYPLSQGKKPRPYIRNWDEKWLEILISRIHEVWWRADPERASCMQFKVPKAPLCHPRTYPVHHELWLQCLSLFYLTENVHKTLSEGRKVSQEIVGNYLLIYHFWEWLSCLEWTYKSDDLNSDLQSPH